jgi:hypothetical protein
VLDYVPLWHSLEEILITYSIEFEEFGFKRYTIEQDPVTYFKKTLLDITEELDTLHNENNSVTQRSVFDIQDLLQEE